MKKTLTLLLSAVLLISCLVVLSACGNVPVETDPIPPETEGITEPSESESLPSFDPDLKINVSVLNGTTGFGAAKLMKDTANKKAALSYNFKVETDASVINAGLINGTVDIAALPTNAASVLYNKTQGGVKVIALNTLGVLYVVENGNTVSSLSDLAGKTVYCPAQNPEFIVRAICALGNVENVNIDTTYAQPAALLSTVATSSEGMIAVLPEPLLTVAMNKNNSLRIAVDLTEEWEKAKENTTLVQGCIVVRTAFLEEHPAEVAKFMEEYKASIEFTTENTNEAAKMIVDLGIYANPSLTVEQCVAIAESALPKCNIAYIDGENMKVALSAFLEAMHGINPASVGGALPADDFYYQK